MKLPVPSSLNLSWQPGALDAWQGLVQEVRQLGEGAGQGDAFQQITAQLLDMSQTKNYRELPLLLRKRVTARALTQLWLDDATFLKQTLTIKFLQALIAVQKPMLGIVPLYNLITLYFRQFDRLGSQKDGVSTELERVIKAQLALRAANGNHSESRDLLSVLYGEGNWLLSPDGPKKLVNHVRTENIGLAEAFDYFELRGLESGRYGDICQALYYLETLKHISLGEYDEVFAELLNPAVCKAAYEGEQRIGHVALEILIDRAEGDPGDHWQNFIMDMAGDPRIASHAKNYREWWKPLGESRIDKVRSWLAKEDLRLFLRALEQYGKESGKQDLQRMFPARKYFLEGLERLKLVRRTRLMLGHEAEHAVKNILGSELKTSYVGLADMPDKAVIFIDCGDFCIIEGSHSFKFWVYLAPPSEQAYSYDVSRLTHSDLTKNIPNSYKKRFGVDAPYESVTHTPNTWQNKVFEFLAGHGIGLDIENLLSPNDYTTYLIRFGLPVVSSFKTQLKERG